MERREVIFRGEVQGVGFRYTTQSIAKGYQVMGYVRNESNGSVRLVAEGSAQELSAFVAEIEAAMLGKIDDRSVSKSPATGEFGGFEVRR